MPVHMTILGDPPFYWGWVYFDDKVRIGFVQGNFPTSGPIPGLFNGDRAVPTYQHYVAARKVLQKRGIQIGPHS